VPIWGEAPTVPIETRSCDNLADVITCAKFQDDFSGDTMLQGVEFFILLVIFAWALQQCSATVMRVIITLKYDMGNRKLGRSGVKNRGVVRETSVNFTVPGQWTR